MSSGMGLEGNIGRCFYHFKDFATCMKTTKLGDMTCKELRDDYLDCLHNFRDDQRTAQIKAMAAHNKKHPDGPGKDAGHH